MKKSKKKCYAMGGLVDRMSGRLRKQYSKGGKVTKKKLIKKK